MRAGPCRSHAAAGRAVEGVLETKDLDPQLARRVLIEDPVRRVRVVVAANTGVIASDDEMCAPVVATHDGVEHGFLRPGVAHPSGIGREEDTVRRGETPEPLFIAPHPNRLCQLFPLPFPTPPSPTPPLRPP